jgi:hypothetical protein
MQMKRFIATGLACLTIISSAWSALNVVWPTEHPPVDMRNSFFSLLQPTESEEPLSGNFGCVRSEGRQFHEGIDLRAFSRDKRGEATDLVRSVLPGVVVYTNSDRSKSSYGRYILIEHSDGEMYFLTLYAHLLSMQPGISRGQTVQAGQKIATMGRSASYTIPKNRAHLHFEVCLRLTDNFQSWYNWKEFDDKNEHGNYNGMNLIGINPGTFFEETQWNHTERLREVLEAENTAFTIVVSTRQVPDFVRRYPALVDGGIPNQNLAGWRIDFTYYGTPKKWSPLISRTGFVREGKMALQAYDNSLLSSDSCRGMLKFRNGKPAIGPGLESSIQLLFGFR